MAARPLGSVDRVQEGRGRPWHHEGARRRRLRPHSPPPSLDLGARIWHIYVRRLLDLVGMRTPWETGVQLHGGHARSPRSWVPSILGGELDLVCLGSILSRRRMRTEGRSSWAWSPGPRRSAATVVGPLGLARRRERGGIYQIRFSLAAGGALPRNSCSGARLRSRRRCPPHLCIGRPQPSSSPSRFAQPAAPCGGSGHPQHRE